MNSLVNSIEYRLKRAIKAFKLAYRHKQHPYNYPKECVVFSLIIKSIDSCRTPDQLDTMLKYIELYESKIHNRCKYIRYIFKQKCIELQKQPELVVVIDNEFDINKHKVEIKSLL